MRRSGREALYHRGGRGQVALVGDHDLDAAAQGVLELVRTALGDHPSRVDDHDLIRELVGFVQVLGGQQDGRAVGGEFSDSGPDLGPAARVQAGGRLVEKQHQRGDDQARHHVQPTAHAARPGLDQTVGRLGQAELLQQFIGPGARAAAAQVVHEPQDEQVLPAGQVVVHRGVLPGQADHLPNAAWLADGVVAGDAGRASVGPGERGQDPDGGGLACAVRAEEGAHTAAGDVQVQSVQGLDLAERLAQAGGLDRDHAVTSGI